MVKIENIISEMKLSLKQVMNGKEKEKNHMKLIESRINNLTHEFNLIKNSQTDESKSFNFKILKINEKLSKLEKQFLVIT